LHCCGQDFSDFEAAVQELLASNGEKLFSVGCLSHRQPFLNIDAAPRLMASVASTGDSIQPVKGGNKAAAYEMPTPLLHFQRGSSLKPASHKTAEFPSFPSLDACGGR
jgi:hypothetical protein